MSFIKIPDIEVLPVKVETSNKCIGCNKTNTDIMLTITHQHSTDEGYNGKVYVFFTKAQIVDLINVLDKSLLNHLKYENT